MPPKIKICGPTSYTTLNTAGYMVQGFLTDTELEFDTTATTCIDIYKGTQPTDIAGGWTRSSYTTDLLITFTTLAFSQVVTSVTPYIEVTTFPATTNAVGTGTATWCAIYKSNNSTHGCLIGPVASPTGSPPTATGLVILSTLDIITGVGYDLIDAAIGVEYYGD